MNQWLSSVGWTACFPAYATALTHWGKQPRQADQTFYRLPSSTPRAKSQELCSALRTVCRPLWRTKLLKDWESDLHRPSFLWGSFLESVMFIKGICQTSARVYKSCGRKLRENFPCGIFFFFFFLLWYFLKYNFCTLFLLDLSCCLVRVRLLFCLCFPVISHFLASAQFRQLPY